MTASAADFCSDNGSDGGPYDALFLYLSFVPQILHRTALNETGIMEANLIINYNKTVLARELKVAGVTAIHTSYTLHIQHMFYSSYPSI